ncbi:hypothetical protein PVL29_011032 [Vitis rotundifolia]|uniref:RRP12-like protein n=1 Tax=Vitis rotundifolia TaxID=103349 RepID=A0AA38ZVK5_VITRO|nr:hypothetical protein PVL29_011032 [Vitis rotundifolia]
MKNPNAMEEDDNTEEEQQADAIFTEKSDICQSLMNRYSKSSAPQHRHLIATAAAVRSIITAEALPLTPLSYFAAVVTTIVNSSETLDSTGIAALSTLLSIVLPAVPAQAITHPKAVEAVSVLVELLRSRGEGMAASSLRAVVKCLGVLVGFCDLEDWDSVRLGFETLLKFSVDKRPKVRKCAQAFLERVFKSFQSTMVAKEASKLVLSLFKNYMPLAVRLNSSKTVDGSKPENLEILHMLGVLKLIVPYLSVKVGLKILLELLKLMNAQFSALTRHILKIIEALFETSRVEVIIPEADNIISSLSSYVLLGEKNPADTVICAATVLRGTLDKLDAGERSAWIRNLPLVFRSVAGLLTSEASTASQASTILKELIKHRMDQRTLLINGSIPFQDASENTESSAIKSICAVFENALSTCDGIPNEHVLDVISVLFLELGEMSYFFMKDIVLKLADLTSLANGDVSDTRHLQECIGSAVTALGPERILVLLPISLDAENFTCSNIWLVPILNKYVVGASLRYFMEHVMPLAESFKRASHKVKKSVIGEDLQAHAHGLWGLLPAFCRYPTDTRQSFGSLTKHLISFLKKNSFMHESIAISLQELVNQNRSILRSSEDDCESNTYAIKDSTIQSSSVASYSKKTATKNIGALASCSMELLQALTDLFFGSPPKKRSYLKDAIGCLASISDSSITKRILISSLERLELINGVGEFENVGNSSTTEKDRQRCVTMELASSLVEGANEDLIDLIYKFIRHTLLTADEEGQCKAYYTLSRVLEGHAWFCSSQFDKLVELLLGLKSTDDITLLRSRFACFHILLVHALKMSLEEENTKAFLILNEIILTLKNSKEEVRKVAYDILLVISSSLGNSSSLSSEGSHQKLISMIMGYLSGSSPHIKSGAVSVLSVLVYKDADICTSVPDLVPSVLALLQGKAVEVVKAVLGFVKVVVSCLQARDLQSFLPDVLNGVLPWSSVSRNHFRSKVTVILEIVVRKCGSAAVKLLTPEKYKGFVKTVLENRHSRGSSKEADDPDKEEKRPNASSRGSDFTSLRQQNRGRKELGLSPRKRKREKQPDGIGSGMKRVKKARHSNFLNQEKQTEGQARGSVKKNMKRSSRREATSRGDGERKKMVWKKQKKIHKRL